MIAFLGRKLLAIMLIVVLLHGCTGNPSFQEGQHLLAEGKSEAGLAALEKAIRENPQTLEYRTYFQHQREIYINLLQGKADADCDQGNYEEAETGCHTILNVDPVNQRALACLRHIQVARQQDAMIVEAGSMYKNGDMEGALTLLRNVLMVSPSQRHATALQQEIQSQYHPDYKAQTLNINLQKRISLAFREATFKSVLEALSRASGINFIFDRDMRPDLKVTLFVKETSIEDVLNVLLLTNQLEKKTLSDNTILIYPSSSAKAKEYQELIVKSFYLANADVKQTLNMIKTMLKTRDVFIDEKLNLLIMRDTPEVIRLAEKMIATQDLAEPEVMLDVEVLEVKRSRLTEIGIQYPNKFTVLNPDVVPDTTLSTMGGALVVNTVSTTAPLTLDGLKGINSSQIGIPNPVLNLRNEDSDINLLANPKIRVRNREKAKIHVGEKVPVITTTSTANVGMAESVSYLDVGLKLDVEPNIYLDNEVAIKVALEVSNIVREIKGASGSLTYQIGTRNATTILRVKDGETQALAGLINDEDRRGASRLPGLGDLPVLGHLFSSHRDDKAKTEIILLITPHIVRNLVRPDARVAEFSSGTQSALGSSPLVLRSSAAISVAMPGQGGQSPVQLDNASTEQAGTAALSALIKLIMPQQTGIGKEFAANINLSTSHDVKSAALDLIYDPAMLVLVNFQEGAFMKQGGADTEFHNKVNEKDGRLSIKLDRSIAGAQGEGTLATVIFKVIAEKPDVAQLKIENPVLLDIVGSSQAVITAMPHTLIISP